MLNTGTRVDDVGLSGGNNSNMVAHWLICPTVATSKKLEQEGGLVGSCLRAVSSGEPEIVQVTSFLFFAHKPTIYPLVPSQF